MGTGAFGPIPPSEFANNSASLSVQRGRVGGFFLVASIGGPSEACLSGRSNSKVVGGMRPAAFLVPHTWMNTLDDSKTSVRAFWCLSAQSGHPDVLNQCPLSEVKRTLTRDTIGIGFLSGYAPRADTYQQISIPRNVTDVIFELAARW